jgi:Predicted acyltransferases
MKKENLGFINLYKFIGAIIIACFLHYRVILLGMFQLSYWRSGDILSFFMAESSNYVVELFLILSGMLFAYVYREQIESGSLHFAEFFNKRLGRLLPLAIVTTISMFFLRILVEKNTGQVFYPGKTTINELIVSIILMNSTLCDVRMNPPGWYIAKLTVCYIIAYLLTKKYKSIGKITFVIPVILGVIIRITEVNYPLFELHISRAYIGFFGGVILFDAINYVQNHLNPMIAIIGGILAIVFVIYFKEYVTDWNMVVTMILFPAFIIIGYFSRGINFIGRLKVIKYLGKISFDIYLWNCPILAVVAIMYYRYGFAMNSRKFICLLIGLHIIVGCMSNFTIERITQRWKRHEKNC